MADNTDCVKVFISENVIAEIWERKLGGDRIHFVKFVRMYENLERGLSLTKTFRPRDLGVVAKLASAADSWIQKHELEPSRSQISETQKPQRRSPPAKVEPSEPERAPRPSLEL